MARFYGPYMATPLATGLMLSLEGLIFSVFTIDSREVEAPLNLLKLSMQMSLLLFGLKDPAAAAAASAAKAGVNAENAPI